MLRLVEDHRSVTQGASSRNLEGGLDVYVRVRGLQFGAHAKPDGCCRGSRVVDRGRSVSEWGSVTSLGAAGSTENRAKGYSQLTNNATAERNCRPNSIFQQPASHSPLFLRRLNAFSYFVYFLDNQTDR